MILVSDDISKLISDRRPLVALNLMSLSMQQKKGWNSDNFIYWVDGIFGSLSCKLNNVNSKRIAGRELLVEFAEYINNLKTTPKIALLGGPPEITQVEKLFTTGLTHISLPHFALDTITDLDVSAVSSFDFALVAVSSPKQEILSIRLYEECGVKCICFGGAINMIEGNERAAPQWISRLGLEALYRLRHDTLRRLRRLIFSFLPGCLNLFVVSVSPASE